VSIQPFVHKHCKILVQEIAKFFNTEIPTEAMSVLSNSLPCLSSEVYSFAVSQKYCTSIPSKSVSHPSTHFERSLSNEIDHAYIHTFKHKNLLILLYYNIFLLNNVF
jgi:hypothetical protein